MPIDLVVAQDVQPTIVAWGNLVAMRKEIGLPNLSIESLQNFAGKQHERRLKPDERILIIEQAKQLFEHFYVHAPFKQRTGSPNPLEVLAKLRETLEDGDESDFHQLMLMLFLSQKDAHTLYGLPAPFRNSLAFLPFQIQSFTDETGTKRFVVSRLMKGFVQADFEVGVEVVGWSGKPILDAVRESAEAEVGGNEAAFLANGLTRMCLRPLTYAVAPEQFEETIAYIPLKGGDSKQTKQITLPWGVSTGMDTMKTFGDGTGSSADQVVQKRKGSMVIWSPDKCAYEYGGDSGEMDSKFKEIFEFQYPEGPKRPGFMNPAHLPCALHPNARYGYIRVKNFDLHFQGPGTREGEVAEEFKRLLEIQMDHAPDGLVLDLRGNPGGNVKAAEAMLQMLTPKRIQPAKFHWRLNETVRQALERVRALSNKSAALDEAEQKIFDSLAPEFEAWDQDLDPDMAAKLPEFLTSGRQVTEEADANDIGQVYQGPVVLLVDAFTYSAGDIFAGGFQDHEIGPILGIDTATGGGGATVKRHEDLLQNLAPNAGVPLQQLPVGVTMTVAVLRSTRVFGFEGTAIEGIGVVPDKLHVPTRRDVLDGNPELMAKATRLLGQGKAYRLQVEEANHVDGGLALRIRRTGFEKLDWRLNLKMKAHASGKEGKWRIEAGFDPAADQELTLFGLDGAEKLVVATRAKIVGVDPGAAEPSRQTSPLAIEDAKYVDNGIELRVSGENQEKLDWLLDLKMIAVVAQSADGLRIRAEFDQSKDQKLSIVGFEVQGADEDDKRIRRASVTLGAS